MYTIYVKFECLPKKREAFLKMVKDTGILDAIHAEDGCIKYDYYVADANENEILLIEKWKSKEHQQIHLTQPHMEQLRQFNDDFIVKSELTETGLQHFKPIAEKLNSMGISMAGLDVIGNKVIEINVTSPCYFIKEINKLYNVHLEKEIGDFLLTKTLLTL